MAYPRSETAGLTRQASRRAHRGPNANRRQLDRSVPIRSAEPSRHSQHELHGDHVSRRQRHDTLRRAECRLLARAQTPNAGTGGDQRGPWHRGRWPPDVSDFPGGFEDRLNLRSACSQRPDSREGNSARPRRAPRARRRSVRAGTRSQRDAGLGPATPPFRARDRLFGHGDAPRAPSPRCIAAAAAIIAGKERPPKESLIVSSSKLRSASCDRPSAINGSMWAERLHDTEAVVEAAEPGHRPPRTTPSASENRALHSRIER